jgi:hypothetical protein
MAAVVEAVAVSAQLHMPLALVDQVVVEPDL